MKHPQQILKDGFNQGRLNHIVTELVKNSGKDGLTEQEILDGVKDGNEDVLKIANMPDAIRELVYDPSYIKKTDGSDRWILRFSMIDNGICVIRQYNACVRVHKDFILDFLGDNIETITYIVDDKYYDFFVWLVKNHDTEILNKEELIEAYQEFERSSSLHHNKSY